MWVCSKQTLVVIKGATVFVLGPKLIHVSQKAGTGMCLDMKDDQASLTKNGWLELWHVVWVKALLRFVMIYVNGGFGTVCMSALMVWIVHFAQTEICYLASIYVQEVLWAIVIIQQWWIAFQIVLHGSPVRRSGTIKNWTLRQVNGTMHELLERDSLHTWSPRADKASYGTTSGHWSYWVGPTIVMKMGKK